MIAITYIGKRDTYVDGCYGSKIVFQQGETKAVPEEWAVKFLRHPDQFEKSDDKKATPVEIEAKEQPEEDIQDTVDAVANMDSDALAEFAATHFNGFKINKRKGVESQRAEVTRLIEQFGLL